MAEFDDFVKVGIFKDGGLEFKTPAPAISFDELIKDVFLEALPEAREVNSVGEEYTHIPEVRCPCRGVYWPKMVFMAIRKGKSFFDLMVTNCIICDGRKYFLFDITNFYSEDKYKAQKLTAQRGKDLLNTVAFHVLTEFITGKRMADDEHAEAYHAMRERYEVAGIAREAFRGEWLERKLQERACDNKGLAMMKLGKHEEAIECFNEAYEINPLNVETFGHKSICYLVLRRYEKFQQCADKMYEINPDFAVKFIEDINRKAKNL